MKTENNLTSTKELFFFWLPLASTWLMMAAEQPFLSSIIARLDSPAIHLAAFGVAYSIALIFEAPIIMILSAVTALVQDRHTYRQLFRFTNLLLFFVSLLITLASLPSVYSWMATSLLNLPPSILDLTHKCLILLIPWPAAIGFRRFFQGVLIVNHQTKHVAIGTISRLATMSLVSVTMFLARAPGALTGAAALSAGVCVECAITWLMAREASLKLRSREPEHPLKSLSLPGIATFYYPLALTSFLSLGVHPIATFFISKSPNALESLAVLPVINALVFIFRSLGLSYQEAAITTLTDQKQSSRLVIRFAWILGLSVLTGMALISLTPLNRIWFVQISGLAPTLAEFAVKPAMILVLLPSLTVLLSFQRAVLVKRRMTHIITVASLIEIVLIVLVIAFLTGSLRWIGVTAAATAFLIGRLGANLYLWPHIRRLL